MKFHAYSILSLAAALAACTSEPRGLLDAGPTADPSEDSGEQNPGSPDVGLPPMDGGSEQGADSGQDAGHDGGQVRHLVDRGLFGDMPIENFVMDPEFDLSTGNWYAFSVDGQSLGTLHKRYEARTPTGQPVLKVPKGPENVGQIIVSGTSQTSGGPMTASIWIGRKVGDTTATVSASLLTVSATGTPSALDLAPDSTTPPKTIDDLRWRKFTATFHDPAVGWFHFYITDSTADPYYLSGPLTVRATNALRGGHIGKFEWRAANPLEKKSLEVFSARMRDRLARTKIVGPKIRRGNRAGAQ